MALRYIFVQIDRWWLPVKPLRTACIFSISYPAAPRLSHSHSHSHSQIFYTAALNIHHSIYSAHGTAFSPPFTSFPCIFSISYPAATLNYEIQHRCRQSQLTPCPAILGQLSTLLHSIYSTQL